MTLKNECRAAWCKNLISREDGLCVGHYEDKKDGVPFELKTDDDPVNHPKHYTHGPIEVIDIIEGFKLPYHLGAVIKYIIRHEHKGAALEDLKKAQWYLNRYIELYGKEHP